MQHVTAFPSFTRRQAITLFTSTLSSFFLMPHAIAEEAFVYGKDIDGHDVTSLHGQDTKYIAVVFVATDCPISNRYLPLLVQLAHQFASRGVRLWLIYPNPGDTLAAVRSHQLQYPAAGSLPQLIAPAPRLLAHAHVHVTPEAAILSLDSIHQPALWHGRIDDRYLSFGTQRPTATRHDLADALTATLAGHLPALPPAPPVGCAIVPRV
jgi:AhpC/TSA family